MPNTVETRPAFAPLSDWMRLSWMRRTSCYAAIGRGDLVAIKLGDRLLVDVERGVRHLHSLGARATCEMLAELAAKIGGGPALLGLLAQYEQLSPRMIRAAGADRFAPRPLHLVPRR